MPLASVLPVLLKFGGDFISSYIKEPELQREAQLKLVQLAQKADEDIIKAQSSIIQAEASGESWLQRNWRPLLMLWFAGLVGAHWLGFTAPNISDEIVGKLLSIVQVGIGGYVLGRSGEKAIKEWKK